MVSCNAMPSSCHMPHAGRWQQLIDAAAIPHHSTQQPTDSPYAASNGDVQTTTLRQAVTQLPRLPHVTGLLVAYRSSVLLVLEVGEHPTLYARGLRVGPPTLQLANICLAGYLSVGCRYPLCPV
jgi:hypothetical protein